MNNIKLIVLDVDGTLTDGKVYYDNNGNEFKSFNVKDGMGIGQAIKSGIEFAIITGRSSLSVDRRSRELGIQHIYQGINCKKEVVEILLDKLNLTYENILYIGDDINDLEVMSYVKYAACPANSVEEIKEISFFISKYNGGEGAVREIIEYVLKKQGKWDKIVKNYSWVVQ